MCLAGATASPRASSLLVSEGGVAPLEGAPAEHAHPGPEERHLHAPDAQLRGTCNREVPPWISGPAPSQAASSGVRVRVRVRVHHTHAAAGCAPAAAVRQPAARWKHGGAVSHVHCVHFSRIKWEVNARIKFRAPRPPEVHLGPRGPECSGLQK